MDKDGHALNEARFKQAFDQSPIGMAITDTDGTFILVNKSMSEMLGYSREEILTKNIYEIGNPEEYDISAEEFRKLKEGSISSFRTEMIFKGKYGSTLYGLLDIATIKNENEELSSLIIQLQDITPKKASDKILTESLSLLKSIFMAAPIGIGVVKSRVMGHCNKKLEEMTGYSTDEIKGKRAQVLFAGFDDYLDTIKELHPQVNQKGYGQTSTKFRRKDGKIIDVLINASLVSEKDSSSEMVVTVVDMSEIKNANSKIRKLSAGVEQSSSMIMITKLDGTIEYVNNRFCEVTGWTIREVIGKQPKILKSGHHPEEFFDNLWTTINKGKSWVGEIYNKKKNGEFFWVESRISPIYDENGNITNFIDIKDDITDRKIAELQLIEAKEAAENANRLKTIIMQNIGHELRTPLNGILGFSQILTEELRNEEFREMADLINQSGKRLEKTLNSILAITELETNSIDFNPDLISLDFFISSTMAKYENDCRLKKLTLTSKINVAGIYAYADEYLLTQILYNLIENAIKFTNSGNIIIEADKLPVGKVNLVVIKVIDTGVGINEDRLPYVFDEFRQGSEGLNRSYEGIGLGLAISKKLANIMHGTISVKSKLGVGSVFTVTLPAGEFKS